MKIFRRMQLSATELERIRAELDDYIWLALDLRRCILSAGDIYIGDLRDAILARRGRVDDVYCAGLNMRTGEVNYLKTFNRRNPKVGFNGEISSDTKNRIMKQIEYFFGNLPIFSAEAALPKYSRKHLISALSVD